MSKPLLIGLLTIFVSVPSHSQERTYQERLKLYNTVEPLGDSPFGEQIGLYNGSLSFSHTDIALEGKGPAIVIGRTVDTKIKYWPSIGTLGNWDLNIPRIETLVRSSYPTGGGIPGDNWKTEEDPAAAVIVATLQRCTKFNMPYDADFMQASWWNGYEFINERGQRQPLMKRNAAYPAVPSMSVNGQAVPFSGITLENWQVGCLPATTNGQAGEGFLMVSPEGTRYHLTHLVGIPAGAYIETWCDTALATTSKDAPTARPDKDGKHLVASKTYAPMLQNEGGAGYVPEFARSRTSQAPATEAAPSSLGPGCTEIKYGRMFATMYVTKIEDRFGNALTYAYNGDKLTSITASDGRSVTVNWRSDWRAIDTIVVTGSTTRTWTYAYAADYSLNRVTLPDASTWQFTSLPLNRAVDTSAHNTCTWRTEDPATWNASSSVGSVKTPSNLTGTFDVRTTFFGRSYVPSNCMQDSPFDPNMYEQIPPMFNIGALYSKAISGPGIATQTWTYNYSPAVGSATHDACASSSTCQTTSWVDVVEPDNSKARYTFSTRWGSTEGKQLKVETFAGGQSQPMKTVTSQYLAATQGAYVAQVGGSMAQWQTNAAPTETWTPLFKQDIAQQGRTFTWQVATGCTYGYCFDSYARPTKVVKSSSP